MQRNSEYQRLEGLLRSCTREELHAAFSAPWLNELLPGLIDIVGCDQGRKTHLEGDVGVHTSLVFENIFEVAKRRLDRRPDFIELVSVLIHDLRKPDTRTEKPDGSVSFPGHERAGAPAARELSRRLGLTKEEEDRLLFLVERHGDAHDFLTVSDTVRAELSGSPYSVSLALLQEADALSCIRGDGSNLPVHWERLTGS